MLNRNTHLINVIKVTAAFVSCAYLMCPSTLPLRNVASVPSYTDDTQGSEETGNEQPDIDESDYRIIVSIGDSYSAGEGVDPYYGQDADEDDRNNDPDFIAHRSQLSWPGQLVVGHNGVPNSELRGTYWFFAASSGAEIEDVTGFYDGDGEFGGQYRKYFAHGSMHLFRLAPQLDVFDQLPEDHPADYVTLTLGGNDVGFRKMLTALALTTSYLDFGITDRIYDDIIDDFYSTDDEGNEDGIRAQLREAYYLIAEAAGPQATIIVVGYPQLIEPGESLIFDRRESTMINEAALWLNDEIEALVNECRDDGLNICFVSVEEAFEGHGAYSDDPYLIPVSFAEDEDLKPGISAGTMHPNADGINAYRHCVQAKIDELEFNSAVAQMNAGVDNAVGIAVNYYLTLISVF